MGGKSVRKIGGECWKKIGEEGGGGKSEERVKEEGVQEERLQEENRWRGCRKDIVDSVGKKSEHEALGCTEKEQQMYETWKKSGTAE